MGEILTSGASAPYAKYSKEKVEEHKRQIQRILGVLNPQSLPLDKNLGAIEGVIPTGPVVSDAVTATSVAESGMSLRPLPFICWALIVPGWFLPSSLWTLDQTRVRPVGASLPG